MLPLLFCAMHPGQSTAGKVKDQFATSADTEFTVEYPGRPLKNLLDLRDKRRGPPEELFVRLVYCVCE